MCSLMNEHSHSKGDLSSVILEITEVTQPVASCLKGNVKKESRYGATWTGFLEHSIKSLAQWRVKRMNTKMGDRKPAST